MNQGEAHAPAGSAGDSLKGGLERREIGFLGGGRHVHEQDEGERQAEAQ